MADPLAAASLLLAIIAVLFGAWYSEIANAATFEFARQLLNRKVQRPPIFGTLFAKALPLAVGAWLCMVVFAPRGASIISNVATCRCAGDWGKYEDVQAAFVLSELFVTLIAIAATVQLVRIVSNLSNSYRP